MNTEDKNEDSASADAPEEKFEYKVGRGKRIALTLFAATRGLGVGCAFVNGVTLCLTPFFPEIPVFTTLGAALGGVITFYISSAISREIMEMIRMEMTHQRIKKLLDDKLFTLAAIEKALKETAVQIAEQEAKVSPKN